MSTNVTHRFNIVPIRIQKKSRVVRVMVPTIPGLPVVCTARVQSCLMEFMHIVDGLGLERQMKICQRFSPFGDVELIEVETRLITAETIVLTKRLQNGQVERFATLQIRHINSDVIDKSALVVFHGAPFLIKGRDHRLQ